MTSWAVAGSSVPASAERSTIEASSSGVRAPDSSSWGSMPDRAQHPVGAAVEQQDQRPGDRREDPHERRDDAGRRERRGQTRGTAAPARRRPSRRRSPAPARSRPRPARPRRPGSPAAPSGRSSRLATLGSTRKPTSRVVRVMPDLRGGQLGGQRRSAPARRASGVAGATARSTAAVEGDVGELGGDEDRRPEGEHDAEGRAATRSQTARPRQREDDRARRHGRVTTRVTTRGRHQSPAVGSGCPRRSRRGTARRRPRARAARSSVARTDVGAGAAHAGGDLVEQVLDARARRVEQHPRAGDALLEQALAGPVERAVLAACGPRPRGPTPCRSSPCRPRPLGVGACRSPGLS